MLQILGILIALLGALAVFFGFTALATLQGPLILASGIQTVALGLIVYGVGSIATGSSAGRPAWGRFIGTLKRIPADNGTGFVCARPVMRRGTDFAVWIEGHWWPVGDALVLAEFFAIPLPPSPMRRNPLL